MSMLAERLEVVIGVDTHKHTHTAAAVTAATGAHTDTITVPADAGGYARLQAWAAGHGGLRAFALEGAGGYGAGLARHLTDAGEVVVEIDRPRRPARHAGAKSDQIDAVRAAREVLARTHLAAPRAGVDHDVLALHLAARRGAVQAAADARRQLHAVVVTAPETVRARLRAHTTPAALLAAAATLTTSPTDPGDPGDPVADRREHAAVTVITALAVRITYLQAETAAHDKALLAAVKAWRPDLLAQYGVGTVTAATVLTAWSHPGRFRDEAAFVMLAGTAPVPASSGMTDRHRLNSSGDRRLNCALHTIAITRLRGDDTTRAYAAKCRARGKTTRDPTPAQALHRPSPLPPPRARPHQRPRHPLTNIGASSSGVPEPGSPDVWPCRVFGRTRTATRGHGGYACRRGRPAPTTRGRATPPA